MPEKEEYFCVIRWSRDDLRMLLERRMDTVTEEDLDDAISRLGDKFQDACLEVGWDILNEML